MNETEVMVAPAGAPLTTNITGVFELSYIEPEALNGPTTAGSVEDPVRVTGPPGQVETSAPAFTVG